MPIALIACAAFCTTYAGGLLALWLRLNDKLHLVLGFSAGAVVAVAVLDLLPEAFSLGTGYYSPSILLSFTMLSFLVYLILDRVQLLHGKASHHHGSAAHTPGLASTQRAMLGAGSFSAHSFLDGMAIGVAFQASPAVGAIVTIGVLAHDFSDGINTVNVVLKNGGSRQQAMRWLLIDALAPAVGVASTMLFTVPDSLQGIVLAFFAGFFLYIGASDLVPESHHAHPTMLTTVMTLAGAAVIYGAVLLATG